MKKCSKCGVTKPLSDFSKHKIGKDGLRPRCKACCRAENDAWRAQNRERIRERNRVYRLENRERHLAYNKAWNAAHPERIAAADKRYRQKQRELHPQQPRIRRENPLSVKEQKKRYYKRHSEKVKARVKRWRKANPDKLRAQRQKRRVLQMAKPASYTTGDKIKARREYYANKCRYCGRPANTLDHRIPLARGGPHLPSNLIPACRSCNSRKNTKTEREFLAA